MPSLEILLATCCGERYLPELLDSLFRQSYQDFVVLIADDGSTDSTLRIAEDYATRYPGRIRLLDFDGPAGSPGANFARLLDRATADYVMFCDQDDVWLPNKIALSLEHMRQMEAGHGSEKPLLVHTNLIVAGPALEPVCPSFWQHSKIEPARNNLGQLLMQNVVVGCTILMNRAMYERARPIPPNMRMHDWWCALVASAFGAISCIEEPTILYRQHTGNVCGAPKWDMRYILSRAWKTFGTVEIQFGLTLKSIQAEALISQYGATMTPAQRDVIRTVAELWSRPRLQRFWSLLRRGLIMNSFVRNIALFITVTTRASRYAPPIKTALDGHITATELSTGSGRRSFRSCP
jgi:glycosyltransferase involved in cell wall biosynthesis